MTTRMDDAKSLSKTEIAKIYEPDNLRVISIDGRTFESMNPNSGHWKHNYEIAPGPHRVAVQYYQQTGSMIRYGVNQMTIAYRFEPGKEYTFGVLTRSGPMKHEQTAKDDDMTLWMPVLVDKASGEKLAGIEGVYAPPPGGPATPARPPVASATPQAAASGTIITGQALSDQFTATGRPVVLVPDTAEVDAWLVKRVSYREASIKFLPPGTPDSVKKAPSVMGYGMGHFMFTGVKPGRYTIIFDPGTDALIASQKIVIAPGTPRLDGVHVYAGNIHQPARP
jgi:hypothetical protein